MRMTEGTKSYLIGCHQFLLHPLWVLLAWRLEYKSWPKWWEIICISLHDIGICGRQYLSDDKAKNGHWERGAFLSWRIFARLDRLQKRKDCLGGQAYKLCAGHTKETQLSFHESRLFRADKRSWLVAPIWWLWCNYWVEWQGRGLGVTPPPLWRELVAENLKRDNPIDSHELYMINRREG